MKLTKRQTQLLKIVIDEYTYSAQPVPSKLIAKKYMKEYSPQTIRNELNLLESYGLLEKTHVSSGRIPSIEGYKYYEMNILKPYLSNDIKAQLKVILERRDLSIDTIIDESAALIESILKLPTVVQTANSNTQLKRFDLIPISNEQVLIILVTSDGDIIKNSIQIKNSKQLEDVTICIRIFNDRLVDTPLSDISNKLSVVKEIIRKSVHQYEFCMQQIVSKIFEFNSIPKKQSVYGINNLIAQPEFKNPEKLKYVLSLLDNSSIWKQIAYTNEITGKSKITFVSDVDNKDIAVASTSIKTLDSTKQISIVGPTRMDYAKVKGLLNFIKDELTNHK